LIVRKEIKFENFTFCLNSHAAQGRVEFTLQVYSVYVTQLLSSPCHCYLEIRPLVA